MKTQMKFVLHVLTCMLLLNACGSQTVSETRKVSADTVSRGVPESGKANATLPAEKLAPNTDALILKEKGAVFYAPDFEDVEKMKKEMGEDNFYIAADDWSYYMSEAQQLFEEAGIRTEYTNQYLLRFSSSNGVTHEIDTRKGKSRWGLIWWNGTDAPVELDMVGLDAAAVKKLLP